MLKVTVVGGALDPARMPQPTIETGDLGEVMISRARTILSVVASTAFAAPAFAHPGHLGHLGYEHRMDLVEAGGDMFPIAVVLGIGALAWLWNHRPQPAPAGARKPPQKGGERKR